jgi:hypothetical protein
MNIKTFLWTTKSDSTRSTTERFIDPTRRGGVPMSNAPKLNGRFGNPWSSCTLKLADSCQTKPLPRILKYWCGMDGVALQTRCIWYSRRRDGTREDCAGQGLVVARCDRIVIDFGMEWRTENPRVSSQERPAETCKILSCQGSCCGLTRLVKLPSTSAWSRV